MKFPKHATEKGEKCPLPGVNNIQKIALYTQSGH
jgi:hypothetical protein